MVNVVFLVLPHRSIHQTQNDSMGSPRSTWNEENESQRNLRDSDEEFYCDISDPYLVRSENLKLLRPIPTIEDISHTEKLFSSDNLGYGYRKYRSSITVRYGIRNSKGKKLEKHEEKSQDGSSRFTGSDPLSRFFKRHSHYGRR